MATIKSFTDISQSKTLSKILPLESADMHYSKDFDSSWFVDLAEYTSVKIPKYVDKVEEHLIPCWSLTALLKYLSEIKPQIYTPVLFPSEGKWTLQFVEYGHGNVCETTSETLVDACVEMIVKLHKLNLL